MKYYQLTSIGANREEIGVSPQSTESITIGDIQKIMVPEEDMIGFDFDLPIPKLDDNAKPSTLIDVVAIPTEFLVLKSYFIEFLKNYNMPSFQNWNIKVHYKDTVINDYDLFLINSPLQRKIVDFKKSEFCLSSFKDFKWSGSSINVTDYQNYLSHQEILRQENLWLKTMKITLNLERLNLDMFRMSIDPMGGYYVSEKLKDEIQINVSLEWHLGRFQV